MYIFIRSMITHLNVQILQLVQLQFFGGQFHFVADTILEAIPAFVIHLVISETALLKNLKKTRY